MCELNIIVLSIIMPRYLYSDTKVIKFPCNVRRTIELSDVYLEFDNSMNFIFSICKTNFRVYIFA